MPVEFRLPDLGEGIHEGEVVGILVSVGDKVIDGQPVMLVETDKATTEIPAPVNGSVKEIRVKPGEVVKVGQVLMVFLAEGEEGKAREPVQDIRIPEPAPGHPPIAQQAPITQEKEGPVAAAPSTRRLAREMGIDLRMVTPSGPGGRVTSADVLAHSDKLRAKPEAREMPPIARDVAPATEAPIPSAALPDFSQWGAVERVPLRSVRRATARHMAVAWSQIPHVSHHDAADITELEEFRQRHKSDIVERGGALSLTVFALKAAVAALKAYPRFNATLDMATEEIVIKNYYHIGVAVDTDRGLIVPVIRDVDKKSIASLAMGIKSLAERTRDGKADREDMTGGTFTITNIGVLGGSGFTPIVNHPEVAILGLGQARWEPVVKGGGGSGVIVPRLMLPVILGFDHRVVDGADAARFVNLFIGLLQDPEKLLLQ